MSQAALGRFLAQVAEDQDLQRRLRRCSPVEAAALAQGLGHDVRCGDLLRYESRAFAWQLSDHDYELIARLQRPRRHWWQLCWGVDGQAENEEIRTNSPPVSTASQP